MKRPERFKMYKCPYEKASNTVSAKGFDSGKTVHGRYCKNNCGTYKRNNCELFA